MRPSKATLSVPAPAENASVPATIVRVQRALPLFSLVWATQRLALRRPGALVVYTNATLAGSLRLNEKIVPSGGLLLVWALIWANVLPSRQLWCVSLSPLR